MNQQKVIVDVEDANTDGPKIGTKSVSETTYPSWYKTDDFGVVWDCPGYNDNRGLTQDIVNSFYIKYLFEKAASVKVLVVTDFSDIYNDDVTRFLDLLNVLISTFGNTESDNKTFL